MQEPEELKDVTQVFRHEMGILVKTNWKLVTFIFMTKRPGI
jgi:hypothetical protein